MSSVTTLGRLLWRPYLLWYTVPSLGLAVSCWWVAFLARGGVRVPADGVQAVRNAELELALGSVLIPMTCAAWVAWALYEFLLCSLVPLLPALRRRFFVAMLTVALAVAGLTAWWCTENPGAQHAPPFFALAFASFALGVLWSDPGFARLGPAAWLLQPVALAPIFLAPELVHSFERAPLVLTPLALLAGVGILALPFRRAAMRTRALDPACARLLQPDRATQRVAWSPGRTLAGSADWTRAALHEGFGHARGGWLMALLGHALLFGALLVGCGLVLGALGHGDGTSIADRLYAFLVGGRRHGPGKVLMAFALPIWIAFGLLNPVRLGGAGFCPLSRARRVEVIWRANLWMALGLVLAFGLVLGGASELALAVSERAERAQGVPEFVHVLASSLIFSPVVFEARLRWLDDRKPMRAHDAGLLGLLALVLALPAIAFSCLWRGGLERWDATSWLALVLVLCGVSLALWHASVAHHYATRDLPA